jgi:NaMN:DMB phosphoribosyltransferase
MDSRSRARLFRGHHYSSADDAMRMAAAVGQRKLPGSATLVLLNRNRGLVDIRVIEDGGDQLVAVLEMVFTIDDSGASSLFIITDRSGEVYADRPDDELVWMELVDLAATAGFTLLDWFVVYGTMAFSVAEFAPLPAQW